MEIKSCPFCGRTASVERRISGMFGEESWIVRCDARFLPNPFDELCPVNGRTRGNLSREEAIATWNRREVRDDKT